MRIAIVDDFELDQNNVRNIVKEYLEENNRLAEIAVFDSGEDFLEQYKVNEYRVIILDIYMKHKDGMEIAKIIRKNGERCKIIFVTNSPDFAVDSYDVDATYYIMKPAQKDKVYKALNMCLSDENIEQPLKITSERKLLEILPSKIYWVETIRNVLVIHMEKTEIRTYMSFQKLVNILQESNSFLISCKGCLVNMDYVREIADDDFQMKNGDIVQIRKRGGNQVKAEYLQYMCTKH